MKLKVGDKFRTSYSVYTIVEVGDNVTTCTLGDEIYCSFDTRALLFCISSFTHWKLLPNFRYYRDAVKSWG